MISRADALAIATVSSQAPRQVLEGADEAGPAVATVLEARIGDVLGELAPGKLDGEFVGFRLDLHATPALLDEDVARALEAVSEVAAKGVEATGRLLGDAVDADTPIESHPAFRDTLEAARFYRLSDASVPGASEFTLTDDALAVVFDDGHRLGTLESHHLDTLVADGKLVAADADQLRARVGVLRLLDDRDALLVDAWNTWGIDDGRKLVTLDGAQWLALVGGIPADALPTETHDQYAQLLARQVAQLYPAATMAHRSGEGLLQAADLAELDDLAQNHGATISIKDDVFDPGTLADPVREEAARAIHSRLVGLTRRLSAWSLGDILDGAGTPEARRTAAMTTVDSVRRLFDERAGVLQMDLAGEAPALDDFMPGLDPGERTDLLGVAKAAQRMWRITDDPDDALKLLDADVDSANAVLDLGAEALAMALDITDAHADRLVECTQYAVARTVPIVGEAVAQRGFDHTTYTRNGDPKLGEIFRQLPSYEQLFGNQSFCHCTHCRSILSPAAYFVDTLKFVEDNVLARRFADEAHPLHLRARRPDLWTLPLSCENTHASVSALQLAVERLEETAARLGHGADDEAAIELVYTDSLTAVNFGPTLPFDRDGQKAIRLLANRGTSLAEIARLFASGADDVHRRALLDLTKSAFDAIVTHDETEAGIEARYGFDFDVDGGGAVAAVDTRALMSALAIGRTELVALLGTGYVAQGAAVTVELVRRTPESVQFDAEQASGLTLPILDRLERYARLRRALDLDVGELDFLVQTLLVDPMHFDLSSALGALGLLLPLIRRTDLSRELIGLAVAAGSPAPLDGVDIIDRRFNSPAQLMILAGSWPPAVDLDPIDVGPNALTTLENASPLVRLALGLGLEIDATLELIGQLAGPLQIDPQVEPPVLVIRAPQGDTTHSPELLLLMRHAALMQLFGLDVASLFAVIDAVAARTGNGMALQGHYRGLDDLVALNEVLDELALSDRALDEMVALATAPEVEDGDLDLAAQVIADAHADEAHVFPGSLLSTLEEISDSDSLGILTDNIAPGHVATASGAYYLTATYDPATIVVAEEFAARREEIVELLSSYRASAVLAPRVADQLALPVERLEFLLRLIHGVLQVEDAHALDGATFVDALHTGGGVDDLAARMVEVARVAAWLDQTDFPDDRIAFLSQHHRLLDPQQMLQSWAAPSVGIQMQAEVYRRLIKRWESGPIGIEALETGLIALMDGGPASEQKLLGLAGAFGCQPGTMQVVCDSVVMDDTRYLQAFFAYDRAHSLSRTLPVDLPTVAALVGFDDNARTAATTRLAAAVELGDDPKWLIQRRDALVTLLTRSPITSYDSADDLYSALLIDVDVSPCVETTRVASAIDAVQTYVNRVRMNLEVSGAGIDPPVAVLPSDIPSDQWAWRRNYRVWEANRKVFLYPENYLEPGVRDDKTPLFEAFEATLSSRELNETAIEDAYAGYLRGFEELGRLRIGGAYHQKGEDTDVMHLFGVDSQDPPNWYYRRVEDLEAGVARPERGTRWGFWTPLDLKIPVRDVSPIVHRGRLHVFWVQIATRAHSSEVNNEFTGYLHDVRVYFAALRPDESWSAPQRLELTDYPSQWQPGIIADPLPDDPRLPAVPLYDIRTGTKQQHPEPAEGYSLVGPEWQQVYLSTHEDRLLLRGLRYHLHAEVDLGSLRLIEGRLPAGDGDDPPSHPIPGPADAHHGVRQVGARLLQTWADGKDTRVWSKPDTLKHLFETDAWASFVLHAERSILHTRAEVYERENGEFHSWSAGWRQHAEQLQGQAGLVEIGGFPDHGANSISIVPGSCPDAILHVGGEIFHLQSVNPVDERYVLRRLGTGISDRMSRMLHTSGLARLLDVEHQLDLHEPPLQDTALDMETAHVTDRTGCGQIPLTGPMGVYLREIFLHIPMALARHFQAQGQHDIARRWYSVVFDPTADDEPIEAGLSSEEQGRKTLDRVWRFRGFRDLTLESLRETLTDDATIASYVRDPFNPHAIARLRPSAYQKRAVQMTVDNLLDWGDALFAQETRESLAEARQFYGIAAEILGPRPDALGDCVDETQLSYAEIIDQTDAHEPFLREAETLTIVTTLGSGDAKGPLPPRQWVGNVRAKAALREERRRDAEPGGNAFQADPSVEQRFDAGAADAPVGAPGLATWQRSVVLQMALVFCVPPNEQLIARWDRLEDRLYKLRNCLRLDGSARRTAPFAPEVDPMAWVRARAAGMPLGGLAGLEQRLVPAYRFQALIGRARQYAGAVQRLGASLTAALERRDAEQLARLRQAQAHEIATLTSEIRTLELNAGDAAIAALERQREGIEYRRKHYAELIREGNLAMEHVEVDLRVLGQGLQVSASLAQIVAGGQRLAPNLASLLIAMFGGEQLGESSSMLAHGLNLAGSAALTGATVAGAIAAYTRREQGWKLQQRLAEKDLAALEPQLEAARTRRRIAERSSEIHDRSLAHIENVLEFFDNRATNADLYAALAKASSVLYRKAYDAALRFARLTEAAFRFERDEADASVTIDNHWKAGRGGLLAGEGLMLDLDRLERRFIETHDRTPELNQNIALSQVDPGALLVLRRTGECDFSLPTYLFDMNYPGHYRRRIKGVRLTIACTGEITTNISARLSMTRSAMRFDPVAATQPTAVPLSRSTTIATSTGEGDAGVFVFDFNGERYMPFEGMGAISTWSLAFPQALRPFDYAAISDVVLNMSYVARDDAALRTDLEGGSLIANMGGIPFAFSLKEHASSAFYTLVLGDATTANVQISTEDLPVFLRDQTLTVSDARLVIESDEPQAGTVFLGGVDQGGTAVGAEPPGGGGPVPSSEFSTVLLEGVGLDAPMDLQIQSVAWSPDAIRDIVILMTLTIN